MAQATIEKRIRQSKRIIFDPKVSDNKRERFANKVAFLETLSSAVRFFKGPKVQGEGGYR